MIRPRSTVQQSQPRKRNFVNTMLKGYHYNIDICQMRFSIATITIIIALGSQSCRPSTGATGTVKRLGPRYADSLHVTVVCANLSENMTANDEILILCYPYRDPSQQLQEPLFSKRLHISQKANKREFTCKVDTTIVHEPLLLFLLELDSELTVNQIDSTLRVDHPLILSLLNAGNYALIEKYFADDDVLGYRLIPMLNYDEKNVYDFTGRYKLDKYEYQLTIQRKEL